jgi:hypothetical protein
MRKWNWSAFFLVTCVGCIGGLSNKSIPSTLEALLFGLTVGGFFGLLFAYVTRED